MILRRPVAHHVRSMHLGWRLGTVARGQFTVLNSDAASRCILWAGVISLGSGCMGLSMPAEAPHRHTLLAPPLVVHSDVSLSREAPLIQELVAPRAEIARTLDLPDSQVPITLYVFQDRDLYRRYVRLHYPQLPDRRAFFVADRGRAAVYGYLGDQLAEDLRHELTHAVLHTTLGELPLWLDEGLAEYFEVPSAADGLHNLHLRKLQVGLAAGWQPSLARLQQKQQVSEMDAADYREAWAWTYFLLRGPPPVQAALRDYLRQRQNSRELAMTNTGRLALTVNNPEAELCEFISSLAPADQGPQDGIQAGLAPAARQAADGAGDQGVALGRRTSSPAPR